MSSPFAVVRYNNIKIRILHNINGPWFCGRDIANALGYKDTRKAIDDNTYKADVMKLSELIEKSEKHRLVGNMKGMKLINKSGLTSFLVKTKLPNTEHFIQFCNAQFDVSIKQHKFLTKEQECIGAICESFMHLNYTTQFSVDKYRIDLYFHDERLAIECDEHGHVGYNCDEEIEREIFIRKRLNCEFIRFNPDAENFSVFGVINKIMIHLQK